jgi:CheY-like chemotaxis protein
LDALQNEPFDVLVADIAMPERDGYSLIRAVRELPTLRSQIPSIAVTGYASPADRELALSAGFNGHIAKPVDPTRLLAAVVQLRNRHAIVR